MATLEDQLEELLDQETFPPPDGFKEQAVVSDDAIYEQAEDYEAFWAERAEALHWDTKWDQVLDWSNPPFAKWFLGGELNVAYNCVDRHVAAGLDVPVDAVVRHVQLAADEPLGERRIRPVQHLVPLLRPGEPLGLFDPVGEAVGGRLLVGIGLDVGVRRDLLRRREGTCLR